MDDSLVIRKDKFEDYYDILEEIGSGQFAVVKKCVEKNTSSEFAAKCIKKKRAKSSRRGVSAEQILREATVLRKAMHHGVIYLHEVFETSAEFTLVLELLSGGELFEFLIEQEYLTENEAMDFTKQVVEAVHYLHDRHIVHLDIKPENIVLKDKTEKKVKLIDFGLARIITPGEIVKAIMGTAEFVAPEIINYEPVGTPTDMWAVGVLAYILLSGASPFLADDDNEIFVNIQNVDYEFDDEYFADISSQAKDFISSLLLKKPEGRLSARDCFKHAWLCEPEPEVSLKRRSTLIKTQTFKAFTARARWRTSMKKVIVVNRLAVLAGKKGGGMLPTDMFLQVPDQLDDNKNTLQEICKESGIEIEKCVGEIIQAISLENMIEETALIRRKSLRTAERKSLVLEDSAQEPIEEEFQEDWHEEKIVYAEYKELVRLIEDHVILPFDIGEWRTNEGLEVIRLYTRKETTV